MNTSTRYSDEPVIAARGIDSPEGVATLGATAKPQEPGAREGTRPDESTQPPAQEAQQERDALSDGDLFWLWKNGNHFLAFRHPYPCYSPGGDPMTLGDPFGVAIFRSSYDRDAPAKEGEGT